ncbi:BcPG4, endopolygalacturonase 4 [Xylariales sp. PMI_506]|nr:BcPG4, endopolygalacturonase 4 [Xylariales sp. PMI_506]
MHSAAALIMALAAAAPVMASPAPAPTPAPSQGEVKRAIEERAAACTFSGSAGYSSASKSKSSCSTIVLDALTVPAGKTLDLTDLPDDTTVIFEGTTTFEYSEWDGPLFAVSGTGIKVTGTSESASILDGQGASYWDGEGGSGGKTKPKFFQAHSLTDSTIELLTILNPPVQVFSIDDASDLTISYVTIDAKDGDSLGKNTDGFDVGSSTGVTIDHATVYNQDDCIAINSGTDITFSNGYCSGGHGLSIGSVGGRDDNTVETIVFESTTVIDSVNGLRIKTISGDTGTVKGVTYEDITLTSISKYGLIIEQNYDGGDLDGTATTGVPITDVTFKSVTGTVESSGYNYVVVCGSSSSCADFTVSSLSISGGKSYSSCENAPSGITC